MGKGRGAGMLSIVMSAIYIALGLLIIFFINFYHFFKPKIKLVLWDLDGTLINNTPAIFDGFKMLFATYRPEYKYTEEDLKTVLGPPLEQSMKRFFKQDPATLIKQYRAHQAPPDLAPRPFPGIIEVIKELKSRKIKNVILSNKSHAVIEKNLKDTGLDNLFESVIGAEDCPRPKPSCSGVLKALKKYKVWPFNALMIGDNVIDIDAGKALYLRTAVVSYSAKLEECQQRQPDYLISDVKEFVHGL
jgi:HAD superfamily hydrolase (TIGR01509 family)